MILLTKSIATLTMSDMFIYYKNICKISISYTYMLGDDD